jgi:hypothetical protein
LFDVVAYRIECDRAQAVFTDEPDYVRAIPRADVDNELPALRAEVSEGCEQPFGAARLEALLQLEIERVLVRPELPVELLD